MSTLVYQMTNLAYHFQAYGNALNGDLTKNKFVM